MKQILLTALLGVMIFACNTPQKLVDYGRYDEAITKSVKKLKKNSTKQKNILILERAYNLAMAEDSTRITFLKKEGKPDNWGEILELYKKMDSRQNKVKPLPKLRVVNRNNQFVRAVDFRIRNFDDEIIQSKEKAAEYYYVHGMNLLQKEGRQNARDAYADFKKVKDLYSNYKDIDRFLQESKDKGTSHVLVRVKNESRTAIPQDLEDDLLKITPEGLHDNWIAYHTGKGEADQYDYFAILYLKGIEVSPESVKESRFVESRELQDGWNYVKDARGNVMKDSLGNDIKTPRIVVVSCEVLETMQRKTARIIASLEFVNANNNALIRNFPLTADTKFENYSLVPFGNVEALSPESRKKLGGKPLPFPNELNMIYKAGEELKRLAKSIVQNNDNLLK